MTDAEKMTLLIAKNNAEESPEALSAALLTSKYAILSRAYPYVEDFTNVVFPSRYDILQVEIANYLLRKTGAEGETGHVENGIERTYEAADIPPSMLMPVIPRVGVIKNVTLHEQE